LYQEIGKFDLAILNFKSVIKIHPEFSEVYQNYLFCLNFSKYFNLNLYFELVQKFKQSLPKINLDKIIQLLKIYKTEFIEIPFDMSYFKKLPELYFSYHDLRSMNKKEYISKLLKHNLYLVNNNKARNYCIDYGEKNNYTWTFALDSNNFFIEKDYYDIINNIDKNTQYIEIPQYRLDDANLKNNVLLTNQKLPYLSDFEPQLAFKNTSKHKFNEKIPYGLSPKAELLNALGTKGDWNGYLDNETYLK